MNNSRQKLLKALVKESIAPGYCENCGNKVEDGQYTLCEKHHKKWVKT